MSIRDRVARLVAELPKAAQYPTQGATVFVDLERREVQRGYTPLNVVRALLAGRGATCSPCTACSTRHGSRWILASRSSSDPASSPGSYPAQRAATPRRGRPSPA